MHCCGVLEKNALVWTCWDLGVRLAPASTDSRLEEKKSSLGKVEHYAAEPSLVIFKGRRLEAAGRRHRPGRRKNTGRGVAPHPHNRLAYACACHP